MIQRYTLAMARVLVFQLLLNKYIFAVNLLTIFNVYVFYGLVLNFLNKSLTVARRISTQINKSNLSDNL